jgi:1-acyl-sn-glycerol-3-phosphate acyltransferase
LTYFVLTRLARVVTILILGPRLFRLSGTENVPRSGALLIVSNHFGVADPALLGAWIPRPVWFMAKAELFRKGFSKWLVTAYHAFPVVRHSPDRAALRRAFDLLKRGQAVVLFPEGTRSEDGRLHRAEPGAGFIARHSKSRLLPVAITGTERVLGRGHIIPRPAPVSIRFGHPFSLPERSPQGGPMDHQQSADFLMSKIAELLPLESQGVYRQGSAGGGEVSNTLEADVQ